jgi:hypothetical protein
MRPNLLTHGLDWRDQGIKPRLVVDYLDPAQRLPIAMLNFPSNEPQTATGAAEALRPALGSART